MPKKAKELSALEIKRLTKPGYHAAGGVSGLLLHVTKTSSKSWILRVMVGTKRRDIGLGGFPDIPLADARTNAREMKKQIRSGIDPVEQRKTAKAVWISANEKLISFSGDAYKLLAVKRPEFKNAKHAVRAARRKYKKLRFSRSQLFFSVLLIICCGIVAWVFYEVLYAKAAEDWCC